MKTSEIFMELEELKKEITRLGLSGKIVIVEGIKDKIALEKLGIKRIITLNKKPIYAVIEDVAGKCNEAAILTDLDREGKKLYGKLNTGLALLGVKVDNRLRDFLFKKTKLRQIEGLFSYLENLQT